VSFEKVVLRADRDSSAATLTELNDCFIFWPVPGSNGCHVQTVCSLTPVENVVKYSVTAEGQ
jgi:hypothetical protein